MYLIGTYWFESNRYNNKCNSNKMINALNDFDAILNNQHMINFIGHFAELRFRI